MFFWACLLLVFTGAGAYALHTGLGSGGADYVRGHLCRASRRLVDTHVSGATYATELVATSADAGCASRALRADEMVVCDVWATPCRVRPSQTNDTNAAKEIR